MFTGIIEVLGRVLAMDHHQSGARLTVSCHSILTDAVAGSSIAVNGTCLTAVELSVDQFTADLAPETLKRTNLGALQPGSVVNLERPLRANARLDGHFVLGHVDGKAELLVMEALGGGHWWMRLRLPDNLIRYVVEKGSLAVDGISVTVAEIDGCRAGFTIIPHTYQNTTLHSYLPGAELNLEVDILAKHLEKLAIFPAAYRD
ncbi:MAG: riboflavin synthase [Bryobacteraceae bacterium]